MQNNEILSQLLDTALAELPKTAEVELSPPGTNMRIRASWKAPYDPSRKSKRFQPVIIQLHEDFSTSELAERPFLEINKVFAAFIRKKCEEFIPRTTNNPYESPTADYWIFPPEC